MPTVLEEIENSANDVINRMRRAVADKNNPGADENHPKLKEIAYRLRVAADNFRKEMGDDDEPAMGTPEPGSPSAGGDMQATPENVLSSPTAGAEPRYAVQHREGNTVRPDPIERAKPSPPAESAGARSVDEAKVMGDSKSSAGSQTRESHQAKREEDAKRAMDDKNKKK
jgi:hypothetical protein